MRKEDYKKKYTPDYRITEAVENKEYSMFISVVNTLIDDYCRNNNINEDMDFTLDNNIITTIESMSPYRFGSPDSITKLQAKLQLLEMELLDDVEAYVAMDRKTQIYWTDTLVVERTHPILIQIVTSLNMSDEDIDNLFILAKNIQ